MELDQGPIPNDQVNRENPKNWDTGTICYDLVPSPLVASDLVISAFQQGHQTFPLVKLKDSGSNALGHTYHFFLPMVPIKLDHTLTRHSPYIYTQF